MTGNHASSAYANRRAGHGAPQERERDDPDGLVLVDVHVVQVDDRDERHQHRGRGDGHREQAQDAQQDDQDRAAHERQLERPDLLARQRRVERGDEVQCAGPLARHRGVRLADAAGAALALLGVQRIAAAHAVGQVRDGLTALVAADGRVVGDRGSGGCRVAGAGARRGRRVAGARCVPGRRVLHGCLLGYWELALVAMVMRPGAPRSLSCARPAVIAAAARACRRWAARPAQGPAPRDPRDSVSSAAARTALTARRHHYQQHRSRPCVGSARAPPARRGRRMSRRAQSHSAWVAQQRPCDRGDDAQRDEAPGGEGREGDAHRVATLQGTPEIDESDHAAHDRECAKDRGRQGAAGATGAHPQARVHAAHQPAGDTRRRDRRDTPGGWRARAPMGGATMAASQPAKAMTPHTTLAAMSGTGCSRRSRIAPPRRRPDGGRRQDLSGDAHPLTPLAATPWTK